MRPLLSLGCVALALTVAVPAARAAKKTPAAKEAKAPETATPPAPKPVPDMPERVIEKQNGDFIFKLTMRPGNLKPHRVASIRVELYRALESPDPVNGDREPLAGSAPVASVQPPDGPAPAKGHQAETPAAARYTLWPDGDPGHFIFHFTPATDGLYQVTISGNAKASDDGDAAPFSAAFRIGAGAAAADTEISQGEAPRHARRSSDAEDDGLTPLTRAMQKIGQRYMDLDEMLAHQRSGSDAAAEAKAIAALFANVTGQVPSDHSSDSGEFDTLAGNAKESLEALASKAEGDPAAARAALLKVESQSCDQCHAKYWYNVTDDVSAWPSFHQKSTKAAAE